MEFDIIKQIDEHLEKKEWASKERDYFHVSELGKAPWIIYNNIKNPKAKKFTPRVKRVLDLGNSVHELLNKYLVEMGILISSEITAVENELFHGRADCIIKCPDADPKEGNLYVLEIKSCSQWVFNSLKDASAEYQSQLQFYMYYLGIPQGMILYMNKDNCNLKQFNYELDVEFVESKIKDFKELKEKIVNNIEPPKECSCGDSWCEICGAKSRSMGKSRLVDYD